MRSPLLATPEQEEAAWSDGNLRDVAVAFGPSASDTSAQNGCGAMTLERHVIASRGHHSSVEYGNRSRHWVVGTVCSGEVAVVHIGAHVAWTV